MVVGIEDGLRWIADGQRLSISLAVSVVLGTTVDGEGRTAGDKVSALGIGTGSGSVPEGTAEVDRSISVGIWSRDL